MKCCEKKSLYMISSFQWIEWEFLFIVKLLKLDASCFNCFYLFLCGKCLHMKHSFATHNILPAFLHQWNYFNNTHKSYYEYCKKIRRNRAFKSRNGTKYLPYGTFYAYLDKLHRHRLWTSMSERESEDNKKTAWQFE